MNIGDAEGEGGIISIDQNIPGPEAQDRTLQKQTTKELRFSDLEVVNEKNSEGGEAGAGEDA